MKKLYIIGLLGLLASCKPNLETTTPTAGNADFSRYVAVGNSLTAGFADGSLYRSGQMVSYPNLLAGQFRTVGGGDFKQPLLPGESGWPINPANGYLPRFVLGGVPDCKGAVSLSPTAFPGPLDTAGSATNISSQGPFNNVGVPGIRCIDYVLFPGYGALNPYAARFYKDPANQTALDEALRIDATFFTMWLGANDVLGYATGGGEGSNSGVNPGDISRTDVFTLSYDSVVNAMTRKGAKGILINIPDVSSIPFFNTVPINGLTLGATDAQQLNAAYGALFGPNAFHEGAGNYFVVQTKGSPLPKLIKPGEHLLLTLPLDSVKCAGWGTLKPIPSKYVLDSAEVANVQNATATFNLVILNAATSHHLGYVDINSFLGTLKSGINFNGALLNAEFATGGAFSLDGVHLTPKGYALAANEILRVINAQYNATLPMIDINKYSGVKLP